MTDPFLTLECLIEHLKIVDNVEALKEDVSLCLIIHKYNIIVRYFVHGILWKIKTKSKELWKDLVNKIKVSFKNQIESSNSKFIHKDQISEERKINAKNKILMKTVEYNKFEKHTVKYGEYKRLILYDPEKFNIKIKSDDMEKVMLSLEHGEDFPKLKKTYLKLDRKSETNKPLDSFSFESLKIQKYDLI